MSDQSKRDHSSGTKLPVEAVLSDLKNALANCGRAILIAPPGAGKTTKVAPSLLDEPWCRGEILLLVPRRLAARAAAEFIAASIGQKPGQKIGYATRLDTKVSGQTRLTVMTHGVFLSRIEADPELSNVSAVLFDEVHERSIDNDLALAFALDAASGLRGDLRLLAMSATPDSKRLQSLLGEAPVIVSEGKSFPLEVQYVGRDPGVPIETQMAKAIRTALKDNQGSLLAFLPGVAEIERTAKALGTLATEVELQRLHGAIDGDAQRAALAPPPHGRRKVVLSTSIAETSVTLDDVRIVVDSGLARRPRYDRDAGLTRLVTERASRSSVTQRSGRAARQASGIAIRLWDEAANASLLPHDPPEILEADLSSLLLSSILWGERDARRLPFLDPPPSAALEEASRRLLGIGAIDADGRVTRHGRAIAKIPLEPRLAHMLICSARLGFASAAADVAVLLTERGLGGVDPDLELRWRHWQLDHSKRSKSARTLASNWCRLLNSHEGPTNEQDLGKALALAFPDRLSKRRDSTGESWQSVGGRGFRLDPAIALSGSSWLAVGDVAGRASGARILSAAPIDESDVLELFCKRIETRTDASFDPVANCVAPRRIRRLGNIILSSGPDPSPDQPAIERALVEGVRDHGLNLLPWNEHALQLRQRARFAHDFDPSVPALDDRSLIERLEEWLTPLTADKRALSDVSPVALTSALEQLLSYDVRRKLDRLAPVAFLSPAGSTHLIDYGAVAGPTAVVRAQALFGLSTHPMIAGGAVALVLAITSPAGRPIQTTKDLAGFWSGSWKDVAKEMRGRYPKHSWPDDPSSAHPTLKSKRASGSF